ncbi:MAG: H(+)/Cl(-) exchange transporter ClcA [Thermomicrobiales bacterium]
MTDWAADAHAERLVRLALIAALSGLITGVVGTAFRVLLAGADDARAVVVTWSHQWPLWGWLIPVVLAALLVVAAYWLVQHFAPLAAGSGIQHVEAVMRGEASPAPPVVLPVKFLGGALALGSGLALGREGPTVQMGATIGGTIATRAGLRDGQIRVIQSAAAGAGLAVAFNAPVGGVAFVFEELTRRFTTEVMVATLSACATAVLVMRAMLGDSVDFDVAALTEPSLAVVAACLVLGVILGVLGPAYNRLILLTLDRADMFKAHGMARAAVIGGFIGLIAWFEPDVVGGGDTIVQRVLDGGVPISSLAIVLVARWVLGPVSYSAGTPGGLFAPLLAIGAVAGALFAAIVNLTLPALALDPALAAIVGMVAFFTAVVRAPLTGIILVLGMTGTVAPILPAIVAALAATLLPALLGSPPIYDTLRERMEARA